MSLLDPIKPYLDLIKLVAFIAIIVAAFLYGRGCGKAAGDNEVRELKSDHAQVLAEIATATADAAEKARVAERSVAVSFARVHDQHQRELSDAENERNRLAKCIADGTCGLRKQWRCPVPASSGPSGSPGTGDDSANLRAEGAADLIGNGDASDADIRAWQSRWSSLKAEWAKYRSDVEKLHAAQVR